MMYFLSYVFSPVGRFRRRDWHCVWMTTVLVNIAASLIYLMIGLQKGMIVISEKFVPEPTKAMEESFGSAVGALSLVWFIVTLVAGVMSTIKRFHDLGKSGWNSLFFYVPLPGIILPVIFLLMSMPTLAWVSGAIYFVFVFYLLIKLAFFKGQDRDNHWGLNPYQGEQAPPAIAAVWTLVLLLLLGCIIPGYYIGMAYYEHFQKKVAEVPAEVAKTAAELQAIAKESAKQAHEKNAQAAARGDAEAQYQMSFAFSTGTDHVAKDDVKALEWMSRAAMQGHVAAQYNLGIFYLNGTGAPADPRRAYFWLTSAQMNKYSAGGTDYRAQAGAKLTPADIADLNKRLTAWKPVKETPPPVAAAPADTGAGR